MAERPVDRPLPTENLQNATVPADTLPAEKLATGTAPVMGESVLDTVSANDVLRMDSVHVGDCVLPGKVVPDGAVAQRNDVGAKYALSTVDIASLVTEHHAVLYRYAYRLTGAMHEAEDLTQQAFLTAQQKLDQLRSSDRALAWLFTILRTCYLKSLRKRRPLTEAALELNLAEVADESPTDESADIAFDAEGNAIDGEKLQAALNELPDEFRLVVVMYYFEELSYREIAARLELPAGTVMSRLSRAKGHLRLRLTGQECHAAKPR